MRRLRQISIAVILAAAFAIADETPTESRISDPKAYHPEYQVGPKLIPGSTTIVFSGDIYLEEITLTNESNSAVTVTISDRQGTARQIVPAVSVAGNTVYVVRFGHRYCPSGVTWSASDAAAITGYIRGRL